MSPGSQLTISSPVAAAVYVTLAGSDPRSSGGGIAGSAQPYLGPIPLTDGLVVTARAHDPGWARRFGTTETRTLPWSAPVTAEFQLEP